jgi:sterol desaturase/sphingolipid hydroxylase (fatty acid hydroxylase superfamily)
MFFLKYLLFINIYLTISLISLVIDNYKLLNKITNYNNKTITKVIPLVFFNLYIVSPLPLCIIYNLLNIFGRSINYYLLIPEFILLYLLSDLLFYITHYIFHIPKFYKYHKIHHQLTSPIGFSAIYAHPLEFVFGNILPVGLPLILLSTPNILAYIWTFLSIIETILKAHGGYTNFSEYHDIHHKLFKYNYGTSEIWDSLFATKYI